MIFADPALQVKKWRKQLRIDCCKLLASPVVRNGVIFHRAINDLAPAYKSRNVSTHWNKHINKSHRTTHISKSELTLLVTADTAFNTTAQTVSKTLRHRPGWSSRFFSRKCLSHDRWLHPLWKFSLTSPIEFKWLSCYSGNASSTASGVESFDLLDRQPCFKMVFCFYCHTSSPASTAKVLTCFTHRIHLFFCYSCLIFHISVMSRK